MTVSRTPSTPGGRRRRTPLARRWRPGGALLATTLVGLAMVLAGPTPAAHADPSFDAEMLTLINQDRAANGLGPVQLSPVMASVAEGGTYSGCGYPVAGRAADMGTRNYFSHTIPNCGSRQVFDMLTAAGVPWTSASENIGWESGTVDPTAAATLLNTQFMNSSGHRANILDPAATSVGVGSWHTAPGQTWTGGGAPWGAVYVTAVVFAHLPAATAQAPSTVTGVGATPGNGQLSVTWAPAAANGSLVDVYGVFAFGAAGYTGVSVAACGTCTAATLTGLADGTPYYVAVFAHNGTGWGGAGASGWVIPGTPVAPARATGLGGPGRATVSWWPSAAGAAPTDAYVVLAYEGNTYSGAYAVACGTCTSATVFGLVSGHHYVLWVLAHDAWGYSVATPTAAVTAA
ncbi:MAG: CAP domain-containing protein [Acidimicrobiales bacterium]